MSRLIYASEMICERPRIWYLAVGANMTIDQSVPGIRRLGERFRETPVQGLIVDYRAATIRQHPFEYSELALSVSLHIPPTTLIAYITGPRNCRKAALMVKLLRDRNFAARGFQRWGKLTAWLNCPPDLMDPIPSKWRNTVIV
ncbi:hypothetical protein [Oceanicaulis sp.]|uniref:hypothetical protein n=1 Tax=Oceanicaulis sp. TaxID=1924941 RepID=UPI003F6EB0CC